MCKKIGVFLALLFFPFAAFANLENNRWIFHYQSKEYSFVPSAKSPRGNPMISLDSIVKTFSLKLSFAMEEFKITLTNPQNTRRIFFYTYSRTIHGETWSSQLSRKIEFDQAKVLVPLDFGDRALRPLLSGIASSAPRLRESMEPVDIVIDPGHGGNDYGAKNKDGVYEKDLNLLLAKELAEILRREGISVSLTRETDVYLSLPERTRFANEKKAKAFLSIHFNFDSHGDKTQKIASGLEIYVLSLKADDSKGRALSATENQIIPDDLEEGFERALSDLRAEAHFETSVALAKEVNTMINQRFKWMSRGIMSGPFYVLYGSEMPALLLELGYINQPKDMKFFLDAQSRKTFVSSLTSSLSQFLKKTTKKE